MLFAVREGGTADSPVQTLLNGTGGIMLSAPRGLIKKMQIIGAGALDLEFFAINRDVSSEPVFLPDGL